MSQKAEFEDRLRAAWRPDQPFDLLPLLPPARPLETPVVLKRCVEARASLAELKRSAELLPNPEMLIQTLPLLEAQASSAIENIVTTADALFQHVHDGGGNDPATREALRYREALLEAFRSLGERPIGARAAEVICSRIKGVAMNVRREPGVALQNSVTREVIYTPPADEDRVRMLLSNWEQFVRAEDDLDPIVRMAAAHYQFEAIHPFGDGNGRTGRVINTLVLVQSGLLATPILYLSRHIIGNKEEYYRRLLDVTREGAWEPWLIFMLDAVRETARWTTAKIDGIRRLQKATTEHVRSRLPRIYSRELVDALFQQPYCRIAHLVAAKVVERQAASRYLKQLVDAGVLEERAVGREKLFVHPRLLRMLTQNTNEFEPFGRVE